MGPDRPTTCKLVQGACRMQPLSNALLLALLAEASPYSSRGRLGGGALCSSPWLLRSHQCH